MEIQLQLSLILIRHYKVVESVTFSIRKCSVNFSYIYFSQLINVYFHWFLLMFLNFSNIYWQPFLQLINIILLFYKLLYLFLIDLYVLHVSLNIWFKCIAPNYNNFTLTCDGQAVFSTNKPERKISWRILHTTRGNIQMR